MPWREIQEDSDLKCILVTQNYASDTNSRINHLPELDASKVVGQKIKVIQEEKEDLWGEGDNFVATNWTIKTRPILSKNAKKKARKERLQNLSDFPIWSGEQQVEKSFQYDAEDFPALDTKIKTTSGRGTLLGGSPPNRPKDWDPKEKIMESYASKVDHKKMTDVYNAAESGRRSPESSVCGTEGSFKSVSTHPETLTQSLVPRVIGYENPTGTNRCYQNSCFSVLGSMREVVDLINNFTKPGPRYKFTRQISKILGEACNTSRLNVMYILKYPLNIQSDAVEFFNHVLEKINEKCPINELFEIKSFTKSTCFMGEHGPGSSFRNLVDTTQNILEVKVPHTVKTLQDVVDEELINTSFNQECQTCQREQYFTNKTTIKSTSTYCLIQLKRTDNDGVKNKTEVLIDDVRFNDIVYTPIGAIIHMGETSCSGHYTSLVKFEGNWWSIDDEKVTQVTSPDFKEATLIIMKKKELIPASISTAAKTPLKVQVQSAASTQPTETPPRVSVIKRTPTLLKTPTSQLQDTAPVVITPPTHILPRRVGASDRVVVRRNLEYGMNDSVDQPTKEYCFCDTTTHMCSWCKKPACSQCISLDELEDSGKRLHKVWSCIL